MRDQEVPAGECKRFLERTAEPRSHSDRNASRGYDRELEELICGINGTLARPIFDRWTSTFDRWTRLAIRR